jgi:uncharacterized alkaline shock family protein YloU
VEVWALIGPSGTGKSHRAPMVAADHGIDMILDDGLLVHGGRIVAGRSAKREETMLAAVKRAVLDDPDHAEEIRRALAVYQPKRLLVLGTSLHMVRHVLAALMLADAPLHVIRIEDVASPDEIRSAQATRQQQGKHVIPAPTFEVRKTFSGYLVDPLRAILRRQDKRRIVERSVVRPTYSGLGRFYIADTVVYAIAGHAAARVPGVARVLKTTMTSWPEGVTLTLELVVRTGYVLPDVLRAVQAAVREAVEYSTALYVLAVDVTARRILVEAEPAAARS